MIYTYIYIHICICMYVHIYTYTHKHISLHQSMYAYTASLQTILQQCTRKSKSMLENGTHIVPCDGLVPVYLTLCIDPSICKHRDT